VVERRNRPNRILVLPPWDATSRTGSAKRNKVVRIQMRVIKPWINVEFATLYYSWSFDFFLTQVLFASSPPPPTSLSLLSLIHSHTNPPVSSLKSLLFLYSFFQSCILYLPTSSSYTFSLLIFFYSRGWALHLSSTASMVLASPQTFNSPTPLITMPPQTASQTLPQAFVQSLPLKRVQAQLATQTHPSLNR
jgi:hypothetical protein